MSEKQILKKMDKAKVDFYRSWSFHIVFVSIVALVAPAIGYKRVEIVLLYVAWVFGFKVLGWFGAQFKAELDRVDSPVKKGQEWTPEMEERVQQWLSDKRSEAKKREAARLKESEKMRLPSYEMSYDVDNFYVRDDD